MPIDRPVHAQRLFARVLPLARLPIGYLHQVPNCSCSSLHLKETWMNGRAVSLACSPLLIVLRRHSRYPFRSTWFLNSVRIPLAGPFQFLSNAVECFEA